MQKWEYLQLTWRYEGRDDQRVFAINGDYDQKYKNQALHVIFNKLGEDGWEIVALDVDEGECFFKRPKA